MKSNIFIPNRINVGFQNREGTYTGKLAYIIYWDEKGKLRKESSWQHWRDENIPNEEFDNEPMQGFVLNKKVGGYCYHWNPRQTYTRVYDPRGFEFEITIPNLLWILENCNCIKGKGLEGEFVYGWDGKELLLVPVDSPDYKEINQWNNKIHSEKYVSKEELKIGATYLHKNNTEYIYMGKFDKYENCYIKDGKAFNTWRKFVKYCEKNNIKKEKIKARLYIGEKYVEDKHEYANVGKQYCFVTINKRYDGTEYISFTWMKTINKIFIDVIDGECSVNFSKYYEELERLPEFSPPDSSKDKIIQMSFEELSDIINGWRNNRSIMIPRYNGYEKIRIYKMPADDEIDKFKLYRNGNEVTDIFPTEEEYDGWEIRKRMTPVTLREIYDKLNPVYKQTYLANGKEYQKEHYW